jgi:hypothetical protein
MNRDVRLILGNGKEGRNIRRRMYEKRKRRKGTRERREDEPKLCHLST